MTAARFHGLDSFNLFTAQALWDKSLVWFTHHVWTESNRDQLIVLAVTGLAAALFHRLLAGRAAHAIHHLHVAPLLKRVLNKARKLIFPIVWLILLFVMQVGPFSGALSTLADDIMNLLSAWIVIRLATQFIRNNFIRNVFALSIWTTVALRILGLLIATRTELDRISLSFGAYRLSALSVVKGAFALCVLLYGAIFISALIERRVQTSRGLTPSSKVLITKIVRTLLVIIALIVAVTSAGIDLSLLAVFSGGIGLGIGFGLQKVVSNIFSGLLLLLDLSIKPGDIIEMPNGAYGWVQKMGARYTEILTRENKSHIIPNENFITQEFINWSHGDTVVRVDVDFGVHYDSDPHAVLAIAQGAAQSVKRVLAEPPPVCHITAFADSAINFKLFFWLKDAENGVINIRGDVLLALWDAFKANKIEIPYPQRVVRIENAKV